MQRELLHIIVWVTILNYNVSCKSNAPCIGYDNGTCINTSKDPGFNPLEPRCSKFLKEPTSEMKEKYVNNLIKNSAFLPNGRCVFYQKAFFNGSEESSEVCMEKNAAEAYCPKQVTKEQVNLYELKICVMCGPTMCNSGFKFRAQSLVYIVLVICVFFY